jgi:hypothetical protein
MRNFSNGIDAYTWSISLLRAGTELRRRSLVTAKRELANTCPKDVDELMEDVQRIGSSAERLRGCFLQSQLPFFLR